MYHISEDGKPRLCDAKTPADCPITRKDPEAKHFDTEKEASDYYEEINPSFVRNSKTSFITYAKGKNNNSYYGANVNYNAVKRFRDQWIKKIGEDYSTYEEARIQRDKGFDHHITILTPQETRQLKKQKKGGIHIPNFNFECVGIGEASSDGNTAWYVICQSEDADKWREENGLPKKDFHITLGFDGKDVHNVSKGVETMI